jgi:drug/metabolite transporter (DMT)-like permease
MNARQLAALITLSAVWGASYIFIRIAAPAFGPFTLMGSRVALAALALGAVVLATRHRAVLRPHWRPLLVVGLVNAALPFTLIAAAELSITASFAVILNTTVPLFAALFWVVLLGDRIRPKRAAGLALGMAGVAVLVGWSPIALTPRTLLAIAAMLGSTVSYGFAGVYIKKALTGVPPLTLAFGQQLGAVAWLAVPALLSRPAAAPPALAVGALIGLALLSTTIAYLLFFYLIGSVGPVKTLSVTYIVPLFGSLWGALFLGEHLTAGMLGGLAIILAGVVLVNDVRLPWLWPAAVPVDATPPEPIRRAA